VVDVRPCSLLVAVKVICDSVELGTGAEVVDVIEVSLGEVEITFSMVE
jgi:hypothetical protein